MDATYEKIGTKIGKLVDEKNKAYGNSFNTSGLILKTLYPNGVKPEQYTNMLAVIRIIDKLYRVAAVTGKDPMGESPFKDIAGYGILGAARTGV